MFRILKVLQIFFCWLSRISANIYKFILIVQRILNYLEISRHLQTFSKGDALESTARGLDMKPSGSYQLEHHGSNMSNLDDDRWANPRYAPVVGHNIRWMWVLVFPLLGFKLTNFITYKTGFGRVPHGEPMNIIGTLHIGPYVQTPFQQLWVLRSNYDADRWQHDSGLQKGLSPPMQPSFPTIHNSENQYEHNSLDQPS